MTKSPCKCPGARKNQIKLNLRPFKSIEHINEKGDGSYRGLSFCFMCSPVEHYFCFYLIFFLYDFEDVPRKNSFRRCPKKNNKLCSRKIGLSSSYLSPVKTIIDVPGKVV